MKDTSKNTYQKFYVGSLPGNINEDTLFPIFASYGKITDLKIIKEKKSNKCAGFGFITFQVKTDQQAQRLEAMLEESHSLDGRAIKVQRHLSGRSLENHIKGHQKKRVYVSNLPKNLSDEELSDFFSQFGEIESAYRVKIQSEDRLTNYGYVTFTSEYPVNKIFSRENIPGSGVTLEIRRGKQVKVQNFVKGSKKNYQWGKSKSNSGHNKNRNYKSYGAKGKYNSKKKRNYRNERENTELDKKKENQRMILKLGLKPTNLIFHQLVNIDDNWDESNFRFNRIGLSKN